MLKSAFIKAAGVGGRLLEMIPSVRGYNDARKVVSEIVGEALGHGQASKVLEDTKGGLIPFLGHGKLREFVEEYLKPAAKFDRNAPVQFSGGDPIRTHGDPLTTSSGIKNGLTIRMPGTARDLSAQFSSPVPFPDATGDMVDPDLLRGSSDYLKHFLYGNPVADEQTYFRNIRNNLLDDVAGRQGALPVKPDKEPGLTHVSEKFIHAMMNSRGVSDELKNSLTNRVAPHIVDGKVDLARLYNSTDLLSRSGQEEMRNLLSRYDPMFKVNIPDPNQVASTSFVRNTGRDFMGQNALNGETRKPGMRYGDVDWYLPWVRPKNISRKELEAGLASGEYKPHPTKNAPRVQVGGTEYRSTMDKAVNKAREMEEFRRKFVRRDLPIAGGTAVGAGYGTKELYDFLNSEDEEKK